MQSPCATQDNLSIVFWMLCLILLVGFILQFFDAAHLRASVKKINEKLGIKDDK